jgi:hypothetical protein
MTLHALFTEDGIPGWIGTAPREGSEPVEGLEIAFLASHRRTSRGKWVARTAVVPLAPSAEDLAAHADAEHQVALERRDVAVREALATEADPLFFRWQRGEVDEEAWLCAVAAVKARFPKPGRA